MRSKQTNTHTHTTPVSSVKQLKVSCTSGLNPTDMIKYNDAHKYLLERNKENNNETNGKMCHNKNVKRNIRKHEMG